jgi:hypothetical protein
MKKDFLRLFFFLTIFLFLFAWQTADSQTAWVKTVFASDTFTGKVVGVSDDDTISVMRGGRGNKRGLWADKNRIPPWGWRRGERARRVKKEQVSGVYHGNVKSHVFHRPGRRYYDCRDCTAIFKSREEAVKGGHSPCKVSKP